MPVRWKPWDIDDFFEDIRLISAGRNGDLALDVYEDKDTIFVEINTAGIDPDKIEIAVHDRTLRVSGSRDETEVVEDRYYYRKEIRRGSFERIISLPSTVDQSKVTAECKDGVLRIALPKIKATKQSTIKIVKK